VVGVAVGAVVPERDHGIGPQFVEQSCDLVDQYIRGHLRQLAVDMVERDRSCGSQPLARFPKLLLAHLAQRSPAGDRRIPDLSGLTARGADDGRLTSGGRPLGDRPASAEHLIVGMCEDPHDSLRSDHVNLLVRLQTTRKHSARQPW
jgi:hypothetical protein